MSPDYVVWLGDCLIEMDNIPDGSIDMILCDPPYGTTACKWDVVIPFEPLWKQYKRVIKKQGAVVLFGSEPFSSLLRLSNLEWFKYDWVWEKSQGHNFLQAKSMPLKVHEVMSIFSRGTINHLSDFFSRMIYYPVMEQGEPYRKVDRVTAAVGVLNSATLKSGFVKENNGSRYPRSVIHLHNTQQGSLHPTQKPVTLLSYLIKTYTNEGETVLDNTMGSGSTGEACLRTNRRFIGIEKDAHYFNVAQQRLERVAAELSGQFNHS